MPVELQKKVFEDVEEFPIGMDEAKEIRLKLMEERSIHGSKQDELFKAREFSLSEH
jgi:hypothetical protein